MLSADFYLFSDMNFRTGDLFCALYQKMVAGSILTLCMNFPVRPSS